MPGANFHGWACKGLDLAHVVECADRANERNCDHAPRLGNHLHTVVHETFVPVREPSGLRSRKRIAAIGRSYDRWSAAIKATPAIYPAASFGGDGGDQHSVRFRPCSLAW
ncbi:hypothetical protein BEL01nite_39740 [Bradyrhizobium elkanii]|nr:hypothetical protein BEL01nite_39740 [Bradyrhizobium elkanii]